MSPVDSIDGRGALSARVAEGDAARLKREQDAIRRVSREFEALMVNEMLKAMRKTVGKDPLLGGGNAEEIYRSMLDQEYAQAIALQGGLGLAPLIERELMKVESMPKVERETKRVDD